MRHACWLAMFLVLLPGLALAGANEDGVLVVHANPSLLYTSDTTGYCGQSGLADCASIVDSVAWDPDRITVFHILAAFPESSSPRLKAVSYGVDWDDRELVLVAHGSCADFDIPDGGWPASGTGIGSSFTQTRTDLLVELQWFAAYAYADVDSMPGTRFQATPHPVQGGVFADDAVPPVEDAIAAYGCLGFGRPGSAPCPGGFFLQMESWIPGFGEGVPEAPQESEMMDCIDYRHWLHWSLAVETPSEAWHLTVSGNRAYVVQSVGFDNYFSVVDNLDGNPTVSGSLWMYGTLGDVAVRGAYAYVVRDEYTQNAHLIDIIDIQNPAAPTWVTNRSFSAPVHAVEVSGDYLYVARGVLGLVVFDLQDPTQPFVCFESVALPAYDVAVSGNRAIVSGGDGGVRVLDATHPCVLLGGQALYNTPGDARGVAALGDLGSVADGSYGLQVFDISDPWNIDLVGSVDTGDADAVQMWGSYALVIGGRHLSVVDIAHPSNPTIVADLDFREWIHGVGCSAERILLANGPAGVQVVEPAGLYWLPSVSQTGLPGPGLAHHVALAGSYAIVADGTSGLAMLDCSDPSLPRYVTTVDTPGSAFEVAMQPAGVSPDTYGWVADGSAGVQVVRFPYLTPENPYIVGAVETMGVATGIALHDPLAYVAAGTRGLKIVYMWPPESPSIWRTVDTPGTACDVALTDNYAFIADQNSLVIIDIDPPDFAEIVGSLSMPTGTFALGVDVHGSYAYVATGDGIRVVDVSDPANPVLETASWTTSPAVDIRVVGNRAYVATGAGGLVVLDISNPLNPRAINAAATTGYAAAAEVAGSLAFVAQGDAGLEIVKRANPQNPPVTGWVDTPGTARSLVISGETAFVADGQRGLQVVDISAPEAPEIVTSRDTPGEAWDVAVAGSYAYVADGLAGLQVILLGNPPVIRWTVDTPAARGLALSSGLDKAYVADHGTNNNASLRVIDVNNPEHAVERGSVSVPGQAYDVVALGSYAYVADGTAGLTTVDVSNPDAPFVRNTLNVSATAYGVSLDDGYLFLSCSDGLRKVSLTNPAQPSVSSTVTLPCAAYGAAAAGDYVHVANAEIGLQIVSFDSGRVIGTADMWGDATGVAISGDFAYVTASSVGLEVFPAQCADVMGVPEVDTAKPELSDLRIVPNPSSSEATLRWTAAARARVSTSVYDVSGRRVRALFDGPVGPGPMSLSWDGRDDAGHRVASGIYWLNFRTKGQSKTMRAVLIR